MKTLENIKKQHNAMEYLFQNIPLQIYKSDDVVEGIVIGKRRGALYMDIENTTGIVFGKHFNEARDIIKDLRIGDKITAKIIGLEIAVDYAVLSIKQASEEVVFRGIEEYKNKREQIKANVVDANKGGLILEWNSLKGFLPASNLKPEHYPRVEDGDKNKIMEELKKLVGLVLDVIILDINQKEKSLIFSEKNLKDGEGNNFGARYKAGDIIETEVTGVVDFGIFVKIDSGFEGLVHISELDWSLIENPRDLFKMGDKIKVKVLDAQDNKISLSVKALKEDPWEEVKQTYHKGDIVSGVVIRFNKHGALISIKEGVAGLT